MSHTFIYKSFSHFSGALVHACLFAMVEQFIGDGFLVCIIEGFLATSIAFLVPRNGWKRCGSERNNSRFNVILRVQDSSSQTPCETVTSLSAQNENAYRGIVLS